MREVGGAGEEKCMVLFLESEVYDSIDEGNIASLQSDIWNLI